jgi:hypothetical protein
MRLAALQIAAELAPLCDVLSDHLRDAAKTGGTTIGQGQKDAECVRDVP